MQNWVQIYQFMQSGVGKLSCNKTALKRCTSTAIIISIIRVDGAQWEETLRNSDAAARQLTDDGR